MNIRTIQPKDIPAICRIYNYYVKNTTVTFEITPVPEEEMKQRIEEILKAGFPYYVLEAKEKIAGFAYIHLWHPRAAYSSTKEVTIYLDPHETGKGYGSKLYQYLFENIDYTQTHALIALICIPNEGSVKLHEKFGFRQVSCLKEVGYKFNQWLDVGHWQLNPGNTLKNNPFE